MTKSRPTNNTRIQVEKWRKTNSCGLNSLEVSPQENSPHSQQQDTTASLTFGGVAVQWTDTTLGWDICEEQCKKNTRFNAENNCVLKKTTVKSNWCSESLNWVWRKRRMQVSVRWCHLGVRRTDDDVVKKLQSEVRISLSLHNSSLTQDPLRWGEPGTSETSIQSHSTQCVSYQCVQISREDIWTL